MPRRRQKSVGKEGRWGKREREKELKIKLNKLRLRLGVVETMLQLEVIRRQNIIEEIIKISSFSDLENLIINFKLK